MISVFFSVNIYLYFVFIACEVESYDMTGVFSNDIITENSGQSQDFPEWKYDAFFVLAIAEVSAMCFLCCDTVNYTI